MPRKKLIPDLDVLQCAEQELTRVGPERLTLAAVGKRSGIAAATLVQRFGSKRQMLLEIARRRAERVKCTFSEASGLDSAFLRLAREFQSPEGAANQLAFLHLGLGDSEFRSITQELLSNMEHGALHLLWRAVKAGTLDDLRGIEVSRACVAAYWGALAFWSIKGSGELGETVQSQLAAVLRPYREESAATSAPSLSL
jgi:AcrR family transcriptional regulator